MTIDPFRTEDIAPFLNLAAAEGWVAEPWEFEFLLSEFSQGCFAARGDDGEVTVVTGGVDSPIAPLILRGFQLMRIMSTSWNKEPQRASRPFSKDRDGFVIAEGSWFFVMEEMERAKARGAHIYGEIAGYGSTCEAYHRVRLEECGEEPARAIGIALKEGGIQPSDVQYIHYHGTSTELNDRIETRAMKLAFGDYAYKLAGSSLKLSLIHI